MIWWNLDFRNFPRLTRDLHAHRYPKNRVKTGVLHFFWGSARRHLEYGNRSFKISLRTRIQKFFWASKSFLTSFLTPRGPIEVIWDRFWEFWSWQAFKAVNCTTRHPKILYFGDFSRSTHANLSSHSLLDAFLGQKTHPRRKIRNSNNFSFFFNFYWKTKFPLESLLFLKFQ